MQQRFEVAYGVEIDTLPIEQDVGCKGHRGDDLLVQHHLIRRREHKKTGKQTDGHHYYQCRQQTPDAAFVEYGKREPPVCFSLMMMPVIKYPEITKKTSTPI